MAVDVDPGACHAARENARNNQVAGRMTVREGSLERVRGTFDLILANLYLEPLRKMAPRIARRLAERGRAVLSGLLAPQAAGLEESLKTAGLRVERRRSEAGWSCVTVCKGAGLRPPGSG